MGKSGSWGAKGLKGKKKRGGEGDGEVRQGRENERRGWMRGKGEGRRGPSFHLSPQEICVWFKCSSESLLQVCVCVCLCTESEWRTYSSMVSR